MVEDTQQKDEKKVELDIEEVLEDEAPEGGWGWVVAFGLALVLVVAFGPMACFGLIFGDFLESLGEGTRGVTLINSVYMAVYSFSGLFTNYALKSYSCRRVALVGSVLFFIGNMLTSFAESVLCMIFSFGVLPGVGLGLMLPASFHCFNDYFVRRRVFVMGIAQTTLSAGVMVYPIIVEKLMEEFGYKGAQAIVAAMSLGATLGALSFLPAHKKPLKLRDIVSKRFIQKVNCNFIISNISGDKKIGSVPRLSVEDASLNDEEKQIATDSKESGKLMHSLETIYANGNVNSDVSSGKQQNSLTVDWKAAQDQTSPLIMENGLKHSHSRSSSVVVDGEALKNGIANGGINSRAHRLSIISTGSIAVLGVDNTIPSVQHSPGNKRYGCSFVEFLDLTLLKDPVYVNLVLGVSCAFFSDFTFVTLFPLFMFSLGYTMSETAYCIAVGAACDLAGRVAFSLIGAWTSIRSRTIFLIGAICMLTGRLIMIYAHSYLVLLIITGFHGFFRAWVHANFALVFAEHVHRHRFPSAYGLYMAISGIIGISTGPLVGLIRDATDSYPICIHALNIQMLLCIVPWILELSYVALFRKNTAS